MDCARCGLPIMDKEQVIQIKNGVWDNYLQKVDIFDYGKDTPMVTLMHKTCFRKMTHRLSLQGKRVGFYADGDDMIPRTLHD